MNIFLVLLIYTDAYKTYGGKPPKIKIINMETCGVENEDAISYSFELNNVDTDEYKALDMEFDTKIPFDDTWAYTLTIDKKTDGDWELDVYSQDGNLCDVMKEYVQRAWMKLMDLLEPKPEGFCKLKPGKYSLKGYEILTQDITFPPLYGSLRATLKSINKDNEVVFCGAIYLDITEE